MWPLFKWVLGRVGCQFDARKLLSKRADGQEYEKHIREERKSKQAGRSGVLWRHPNLSCPQGISPGFSTSPLDPFAHPLIMQNLRRRFWRSVGKMEEWHLAALLCISSLSLWGLCMLVLPCIPSFLAILGLGNCMTWWLQSKAKPGAEPIPGLLGRGPILGRSSEQWPLPTQPGPRSGATSAQGTSARKRSWRSRRKDPIGASIPWEGAAWSTESLKAGWGKPHGGEWWGSNCGGEAACARELPRETGDMGQGGNFSADTSSELLRNQPSITNMEELARSLMESLDVTQICLDLLGELKAAQDSGAPTLCKAVRKEYLVCLQCRRRLMGSCPHRSEPAAEQDLPMLAAILYSVDLLVHEEDLQLELGLGFELAIGGEPLYVWEITQRLPEIAPERCCEECNAPLPGTSGNSESLQALFPILRALGTTKGPTRPASHSWSRGKRRFQKSGTGANKKGRIRPAQGTLYTEHPRRQVGQDRQSWSKLQTKVRRSVGAERGWSSAPNGTTEGDQTLPFHLRLKVDALFHATAVEA
ncbi:uncharacterized protein M6G45_002500 [Spheniscus humboldti]